MSRHKGLILSLVVAGLVIGGAKYFGISLSDCVAMAGTMLKTFAAMFKIT